MSSLFFNQQIRLMIEDVEFFREPQYELVTQEDQLVLDLILSENTPTVLVVPRYLQTVLCLNESFPVPHHRRAEIHSEALTEYNFFYQRG